MLQNKGGENCGHKKVVEWEKVGEIEKSRKFWLNVEKFIYRIWIGAAETRKRHSEAAAAAGATESGAEHSEPL